MGSLTNFPNGLTSFGIPVVTGMPYPFTGTYFFVDPLNGSDGNTGLSPSRALATLYKAYSLLTDGANDVVFLIGDGSTTGTARLSTALAQSVDSSATSGTLTWAKDACHLIGVAAPSRISQRARIAPPSGTYTVTTFGSANFIVVSASGCLFANFSVFHGFSTGGANQIALTVTGSRNAFVNLHIGGMGDAGSAADAGSRSVKIGSGGSGENLFVGCTIGLDTVTRSAANASVELAGATPRNQFIDCTFPFMTSAATPLGILGTGNGCVDRFNSFKSCAFLNAIKSTSTVMSVLGSFTTASPGGMLVFQDCMSVGITEWGDTNGLANSYVDMAAPSASAGGIGVNPS